MEWLNALKNHSIQLCAFYKRLILVLSLTHRLKVKGEEKISNVNGKQREQAMVTSDKIDFKPKTVTRDKDEII